MINASYIYRKIVCSFSPSTLNTPESETDHDHFCVVHPLDDPHQEVKCDVSALGPMVMTPAVKVSLFALRAYLIVMMLMVVYYVVDISGIFHHGVPK